MLKNKLLIHIYSRQWTYMESPEGLPMLNSVVSLKIKKDSYTNKVLNFFV